MQLIQYAPTTDKVRERPLLIVPPWINKFYILDLTPAKSLIKFLVDQGFTVFMISWVNPDEHLSHKSFEDYMQEGILTAADAVRRETGVEQCNVVGYCVGGTLLATTLAYLAARGEEPFASASFLATQIDFTHAGDLLLFTDDEQLEALNELMAERGYLDGSRMANVFNMLRPRDLIWPYIVNNYLLGKKPFPFDLLYWNQDSTRMAAANHNFYLSEFYGANRLAKGEMTLAGTRLDMKKVKLPVFELATKEDHIAPAKSVFAGAQLFGGPVEFVLSGSGHIAGVVNPPDKVKYQYWTNAKRAKSLEQWLEQGGDRASGLLVAALGRVARRAFGRLDGAARAGREARRDRGRARLLRQGEEVATRSRPAAAKFAASPNSAARKVGNRAPQIPRDVAAFTSPLSCSSSRTAATSRHSETGPKRPQITALIFHINVTQLTYSHPVFFVRRGENKS